MSERSALPLSPASPRERWERVIGSVDASPFLAMGDGQPAGLLLLFFRRRLNFATWEGWAPELIVGELFQRRGIGRFLLRVAIEEWRLRGAHRLIVETEPAEEGCGAMLQSLGFEGYLLRFRQDPLTVRGVRPPEGVAIRPIQPADFEAATRLVAEMGAARSPAPDRMDALERTFRDLTARPTDASLVAERDGTMVAICTAEVRESLRGESPEAWIPELVVTEQMRGRGIGSALLDASLGEAARRGASSATLESGEQRAAAHVLYQSSGFAGAGRSWILWRDR